MAAVIFALFAQQLVAPMEGRLHSTASLPAPDGSGMAPVVDMLTTPYGEFSVVVGFNCDWIAPDMPVEVWRINSYPDQAVIAPMGADGQVNTLLATSEGVESQMCSISITPIGVPSQEAT